MGVGCSCNYYIYWISEGQGHKNEISTKGSLFGITENIESDLHAWIISISTSKQQEMPHLIYFGINQELYMILVLHLSIVSL